MKKRKTSVVLMCVSLCCACCCLICFFVTKGQGYDWVCILGAFFSLACSLVCLINITHHHFYLKREAKDTKEKEKLIEIVSNPATFFQEILKDAYYGHLINLLEPLFIKECSIYSTNDDKFGVYLVIKKDEKEIPIEFYDEFLVFKRKQIDYTFKSTLELYKFIKSNV